MNKIGVPKVPSFVTTNKTWPVKQIAVNLTVDEAQKLEKYCEQTGRKLTDVIKELIQGLPKT
ncbi:MAG: CopG family transcriptional regulator [Desmonostoc vinosum HA7617-LM4]|jgi:hypothetical protein|nr:CopG family transcriptional regulator [Desmonostoc vinosum HA7617-LM4]